MATDPETRRLAEDARREQNWKRWGPYLAERQWGTVREDYSADGACWDYFPHDHARSRAYRWGEDGLLGITDRECRLCFALALWNGRDPMLKERLFGLSNPEGNHGEDVKECYFYLDATPTHAYLRALYKYPQAEFPYARLVEENRRRGRAEPELELFATGVFAGDRYFDVVAEYAKAAPDDLLVRITVTNRGPDPAPLHVLPTLWFRNTWSWGRTGEGYWPRPSIAAEGPAALVAAHASLGRFRLVLEPPGAPLLFTENETNSTKLFRIASPSPHVKDAFHDYVIHGAQAAVNPVGVGTKAAALYQLTLAPGEARTLRLRLSDERLASTAPFGREFGATMAARRREADAFYEACTEPGLTEVERGVIRQGYAALFWSKQFFHYDVRAWLEGDPAQPPPPERRRLGRNHEWVHLYNRDVISMPDSWEYPWYAAWDLAFHMVSLARVDPDFAKEQLILFLREWYMHPNGQVPAYEFAFGDVNPPVHAWAAWRLYKISGPRGARDRVFLARVFQKLLLNFTWWVNRKDPDGLNIFGGGFLGMDNIGVFDRSQPLPAGVRLEQADGTAWMAFYCSTMLAMALELAREDPTYEDVASKFFEHFVHIADAMNTLGGTGLWNAQDGFYYDQLRAEGEIRPLRVRSLVGLMPLLAVEVIQHETIAGLPGFTKRMRWFLENRTDLAAQIACVRPGDRPGTEHRLLSIPTRERLELVLRYLLDEEEFLSPYGIRSLSRAHARAPYVFTARGQEYRVDYAPGESTTALFGGNSNWRGPIWFPINYLLIEALQRHHYFWRDDLRVECPSGSGRLMNLDEVAQEIGRRLAGLFVPDGSGRRPCQGDEARFMNDPHWRELVPFYEYFHGDTGRGLGARYQGWTTLVLRCMDGLARRRMSRTAHDTRTA